LNVAGGENGSKTAKSMQWTCCKAVIVNFLDRWNGCWPIDAVNDQPSRKTTYAFSLRCGEKH
jgi:hypothetical protein